MADVLLFHHALGLTPGVQAFAAELRSAGHAVTTPDLFDGETFSEIQDGVNHAEAIGFPNLIAKGVDLARELPDGGFVAGIILTLPLFLARGGMAFWQAHDGHPPHPPIDLEEVRSRIPTVRRRK